MRHRWVIGPWIAKRPKWGVEVRRRPQLRHSQIRLALGRRRYTLMNVSRWKAHVAKACATCGGDGYVNSFGSFAVKRPCPDCVPVAEHVTTEAEPC